MTKAWTYGTAAALAIGLSLAPQAGAQDDDDAGGPLVRLLENTLSNDSRTIRVVGLEGALSGQATIEEIIVSDDDGPWLTLRGAVLDWNRLALVRGRFSVNELSADQIEIARRPTPVATVEADLPSPEAEPFALPDLPVAIEIGQISVGELALGEPVIGTAARLGVNGRLALADGTLDTLLSVARLDRAGDAMTLQAGFANDTRQIDLDVTLTEADGGLLATAAQIPDAPALAFTARGNGPVEDFAADIGLATNGIRRFGGTVALKGQQPADDSSDADAQAIGFSAMLGGDLRPLMNVEFHPFFGTDTSLDVTGSRQPDGALAIDRFVVASQGLALTGELAIGASGVPERAMLMGRLEARDGVDRLVLPVSGAATTIRSAVIDGRLDAAQSDDWNLVMTVDGFANEAATIDTLSLRADGLIDMEGDTPSLDGELIASLRGLTLTDETVSAAVGEDATLTSTFALPGDGTLRLDTVRLEGAGLQATANAQFDGLGAGFELDGRASVEVPDLSRFAAIAGRDALSGALSADLTGSGAPLGGAFDLTFNGATTDVTLGIPQADAMLTGRTDLAIEAARGAEGIELRALDLSNPQISAKGTGALQSNAAALDLTAAVTDLGLLVPQMPGPAELSADLAHDNAVWLGQMRFDGPDGAFADLAGEVTDTLGADVTLSAELPGLERFVPQLAGAATLNGMVTRDADSGEAQGQLRLAGPQDLSADIDGTINADNEAEINVAAALSTLEAFVPQLEGAAELGGQIRADLDAQSAETDLRLTGPDDILAEVKGKLAMDGPTDLGIIAEMPMLERFVPQLPGLARVTAELTRTNATADWIADLNIEAPQEIRASADASLAVDGKTDVDLTATLARLETFVPQLPGAALLTLRADRAAGMQDWTTDLRIDAPQEIAAQLAGIADPAGAFDMRLLADVPRLQTFLPQLVGRARLTGDLTRTLAGDWTGQSRLTAPTGITADVSGTASETGPIDASYSATVPELQRLVPQLPGPANLRGGVTRDDSGQIWSGTLSLNGPEAIVAKVDGDFDVAGAAALSYSATVPGLERLVPQLPGTARLDGQVDRATQDADWIVSTRLEAPQNIAAAVDGSVDPDGAVSVSYDATIERLQAFVPQLVGALTLTGAADRDPNGTDWTGETRLTGPGGIAASLDGTLDEGGDADLTFDATVPGVERFVPDFPGTLTTQGTAQRNASVWTLDAETRAPGNTQAQVSGTFNETAGTADMTAQGSVQLGTANAFIAPNSIQGQANFDVALQGAPQLDAVSGQITTSNASIALPQIQNAINNFGGTVALDGGRAQIDFGGGLRTGGRFTVVGPVDLAVPFNGSIDVAMQDLVLTDNISYETSLGGGLQLAGPLTGGAALSGRIDIAETEFNIATAGGAPGSAPVPEMQHIGESSAAFRTRQNAGLVVEEDEDDGGDGGGPAIGLDVLISAPNRIFVRGRGLESELGGQIRIQGSTANIRPSGAIELIRGHLSIFARRIELTRGIVSLQGSLEPTLDFAATTNTSEGDATLTIEGSVDAPKIEVTADPERPTEEALAMLVFGDQFSKLSPLKVAQLAASLARLQGAGGGANTAAREGLGVDSVDLTTDEDGNAAVGVGAYVSDNIYTDVTVNARGDSEVNINLDVTDSFTVKGSVDNESNTSLGIFFERDY